MNQVEELLEILTRTKVDGVNVKPPDPTVKGEGAPRIRVQG